MRTCIATFAADDTCQILPLAYITTVPAFEECSGCVLRYRAFSHKIREFFRNTTTKAVLQIGEQRFTTTMDTLKGSNLLEILMSPSSQSESIQETDGSYFIDADPENFGHILRYLRSGVLPVFYDHEKGHDFALYQTLLRDAEFFGIPRLAKWLREKAYLRAVTIEHSAALLTDTAEISATKTADTTVEHHPIWNTEKVYICPRGLGAHRGNPRACRRQCRMEQGDRENEFEDELTLTTLAIEKKTVFNDRLCLEFK